MRSVGDVGAYGCAKCGLRLVLLDRPRTLKCFLVELVKYVELSVQLAWCYLHLEGTVLSKLLEGCPVFERSARAGLFCRSFEKVPRRML